MLRAKRGGLVYRGDLYIRAWQLQSESRRRAHQHQGNICLSVSHFYFYLNNARGEYRAKLSITELSIQKITRALDEKLHLKFV